MKFIGVLAFLLAGATAYGTKVLMVLTSNDKLGDHATGWYLPEAAHPYNVFKAAGVEMVWASPEGGEAPLDASSVDAYKEDQQCVDFHTKKDEAALWKNTVALKDVDAKDFDAVFVVGGFGVMGDLVSDETLHKLAADIWKEDGVVSGVCHGPAALVGIQLADGSTLVKDKEVACFTNAEEDYMKDNAFEGESILPDDTCEDAFTKAGAKFTKDEPWAEHVAEDGKLITGQNPQSAKSTAQAVVKALGLEVPEDAEEDADGEEDENDDEEKDETDARDDEDQAEEAQRKFETSGVLAKSGVPVASTMALCCSGAALLLLAAFVATRRHAHIEAPEAGDLEEVLPQDADVGEALDQRHVEGME